MKTALTAFQVAAWIFLVAIVFAVSSCAHSDLYEGGKKVAHFEGDMSGLTYRRYADGKVEMSGTINHSNPTIAGGKASASAILSASGLVTLIK